MYNWFVKSVVDLGTKIFLISCIQKQQIFISLVLETVYTRKLKGVMPIMKMSIVDNLVDLLCEQAGMGSETQFSDLDNSWFIVLILVLILM